AAAHPPWATVASDVARASAATANTPWPSRGAWTLERTDQRARAPPAGVVAVQRHDRALAPARRLRRHPALGRGARSGARDVLLHRPAVLGPGDRPRAAAAQADLAAANRLRGRRDGGGLGAGDRARALPAPAL